MISAGYGFLAVLLPAAALFLWDRWRMRRLLRRLDQMLDEAIRGDFREEAFAEPLLSALETKLAHYLSASSVSAVHLREERDKIKSLIADISHQTKTPIANVLLYTQLLEEQELPEGAGSLTAELIRQTEKLQGLIEALLQSSRLESGLLVLHPTRGDLSAIGARAAGQYRSLAAEKGITILLELAPAPAVFDEKWTEEAVCNLLDNAVKYTPEGGSIHVAAELWEMYAKIDITDTGIGIPESSHAAIFRRFYREAAVHRIPGIGIGLYLTREIVTLQGGYLMVASALGKGSTFSVFLPRHF